MIELTNIYKTYDKKVIFEDYHLKINTNEFIGVVGKSGQGKTTLLNILGLIDKPNDGTVYFFGKAVRSERLRRLLLRNNIGFIFQNYALIDNMTVNDNLDIALKHKKLKRKVRETERKIALDQVDLRGYGDKKIHTLSGGEQQRVAIARLLIKDPSIILADEPTGSLDKENRDLIVSIFQDLHRKGKTIIMVTHDEHLIQFFSRTLYL
ncbi:ATP-binding cassette domain-containing protein [Alkalicoccobacillus gibsonii]|uniref:ATP-binding cassette domain-containing protein n=1 Tax=Alkalicoccobacillus gibsonii TaxID=79881 RepID=A0ABU9VNA8_9BACI